MKFEITIDPDAFISEFKANIDGELFIGQTKEKQTAAKEYSEAKKKMKMQYNFNHIKIFRMYLKLKQILIHNLKYH